MVAVMLRPPESASVVAARVCLRRLRTRAAAGLYDKRTGEAMHGL